MSNLVSRMQRGRGYATKLGVHNPQAKDLLARLSRHSVRSTLVPKVLRRSKKSQRWLAARAARRAA